MISSRHEAELCETAAELKTGSSSRIEWVVADMTERSQVDDLANAALERMGRVDILVNNAGGNTPQPIETIVDDDWDQILELNLTSCMRLTRALVQPMKDRRWGRIIFISS
jgi:NAD(P)-dependent dehydrogenase (short-subunit alcohol dehydrogenase family)